MLNTKQFLEGIDLLEQQGIAREITIKALTEAFETIVKKKHVEGLPDLMVKVEIIPEKGIIDIFNIKDVVEEVNDDAIEISLDEAVEYKKDAKIGDQIFIKVELEDFNKQDAMKFKSILRQKIKEAEKAAVLAMYSDKIDEIITGYVEKNEPRYTLVNIGKTSVILSDKEKIGDEQFRVGQSIKVYLANVGSSADSGILISRACPGFLKRLFEEEIHDVFDGTVIIKDIAREAGERSKVSVYSNNVNVDPVGACIGPAGTKIQKICTQLNREKIDIIQHHEHKGLFVAECLKPAVVLGVKLNDDGSALAVVRDGDLRVAIGKRGVNARLAVKLSGVKIDIIEESQAISDGVNYLTFEQMEKQEADMILEARRKAILEQLIREEEEKRRLAEEISETPVEEVAEEVEEIIEEVEETETIEETPVEESKVEEVKVEEVKQEPVEEKKEVKVETPVEFNPVNMNNFSLAELEKQIEEEKKRKQAQQGSYNKKKNKAETTTTTTTTIKKMDIYTQEELEELDYEDEYEDDYMDDDDINYDDYDEYYDE